MTTVGCRRGADGFVTGAPDEILTTVAGNGTQGPANGVPLSALSAIAASTLAKVLAAG